MAASSLLVVVNEDVVPGDGPHVEGVQRAEHPDKGAAGQGQHQYVEALAQGVHIVSTEQFPFESGILADAGWGQAQRCTRAIFSVVRHPYSIIQKRGFCYGYSTILADLLVP